MENKETIKTDSAPAAIGPYSQAVRCGDIVFVSGQLGIDPNTGDFVEGGIKEQTKQALENVKAILAAAGLTMQNAAQVQVFLSDIKNFAAMNEVYAEYFTLPYPARAAIQAAALPKGGLVEILVMAVR